MSSPLRVAMVVEGPTDFVILREIICQVVGRKDIEFQCLQPESSYAFEPKPAGGGGWAGVYRWCQQAIDQNSGTIRGHVLLENWSLLVVQLDADVASRKYSEGHIAPGPGCAPLPCNRPCPPVGATTTALRDVICSWLGTTAKTLPPWAVLCCPSKEIETWVLVALYPSDQTVTRLGPNIECRKNPGDILQGKPKKIRLISGGKKNLGRYKDVAPSVAKNWAAVTRVCCEAAQFDGDIQNSFNCKGARNAVP